jgi:1,4-dihydroxy-2-naphthoate octaprenyltransferase
VTAERTAPRSVLAIWIRAARPATLWAAFAPVLVGTACAYAAGCFDAPAALAALGVAVFVQIGTNFANDLFDFRRGADTAERIGPARAVSSGWVSPRAMVIATAVAFALTAASGLYLVAVAGPWLLLVGAASIIAGLLYTAGPFPLAYVGLGDPFVYAFFGYVAVVCTAYVQCLAVPDNAWLAATPVGALATAILVVNNLRDRHTDAAAAKRTLAVRFGPGFTRVEYVALLAVAFAVPFVIAWRERSVELLAPLLALPLAVPLLRRVVTEEGRALHPALGGTARLLLVYSLLLALALALA